MQYLNETFTQAMHDSNVFTWVDALEGETYRNVASRKTFRIELSGGNYFVKLHKGVGWLEIVKNLLFMRWPILGARNEYQAITRLKQLGIDTMTVAAFAERGKNPARCESFIITEALENTISLEDFCAEWNLQPPDYRLKRALLSAVAQVSRKMHAHGINHRDYYICHFLLDKASLDEKVEDLRLYLIDLHRAQIRESVPFRWRVKDISGLLFSALNAGLTKRDLVRFMRGYSGKSARCTLREDKRFWKLVTEKARKMYLVDHERLPENIRNWVG